MCVDDVVRAENQHREGYNINLICTRVVILLGLEYRYWKHGRGWFWEEVYRRTGDLAVEESINLLCSCRHGSKLKNKLV